MFERTINPSVELRNTQLEIYRFRVRLAIVAGFVLVMFSLLFTRFAANRFRFPGVELNARPFRQYPQGEPFSHVVGYIGRINQDDIEQLEANNMLAN